MSKFDNLFKPATGNSTYSRVFNNNVFKNRDLEEAYKKITYNYHDTEFPDLVENTLSSVSETKSSKNYANIALNVNVNEIVVNKTPVLPGWTQYSKSKQSHLFEVTYGSKTRRQIEQDQEDQEDQEEAQVSNPLHVYMQMITTLECRWARYKIHYDKIHGEGSYDLEYHTEPIYEFDENFTDINIEKDNDYYSSNSHDDYKKLKKYSVSKKQ